MVWLISVAVSFEVSYRAFLIHARNELNYGGEGGFESTNYMETNFLPPEEKIANFVAGLLATLLGAKALRRL